MIFIPVHLPNNEIIKLVIKLSKEPKLNPNMICIIDDNSKNYKSNKIFNFLKKFGCKIIKNETNIGKGASIKVALKFAYENNLKFALFADGDGQHSAKDISNMYNLGSRINEFIIGERNFFKAPLVNKLSNYISSYLFNIKTGKKLKDTQCGLRFIPRSYFDILLKIKENNFEFELICLFKINFIDVKMIPLKIETIYFKDKKITHYKKIIDTIKILNIFFKFFFKNK